MTIESMKLENVILAHHRQEQVFVQEGDQVHNMILDRDKT
jgi:biotin carboxyl carrier protein